MPSTFCPLCSCLLLRLVGLLILFAALTLKLPEPIDFIEKFVGDVKMATASVVSNNGEPSPFFLSIDALKQLRDFVVEKPSNQPQLLVLVGPVKSGKTAVLHRILPALIAADHRDCHSPRPVILRFSFNLRAGPALAAKQLLDDAAGIAASFRVHVKVPDIEGAYSGFAYLMKEIAEGVQANGGRLWLLLDECQVRKCFDAFSIAAPKRYMTCDNSCLCRRQFSLARKVPTQSCSCHR